MASSPSRCGPCPSPSTRRRAPHGRTCRRWSFTSAGSPATTGTTSPTCSCLCSSARGGSTGRFSSSSSTCCPSGSKSTQDLRPDHAPRDRRLREGDGVVRCYPHVVVGYGSPKEFTIDPSVDATGGDNYTMVDFTEFLRRAYSLPRHRPIKLSEESSARRGRPRMMILERTSSRRFMNLDEVVAATEAAGFAVTVAGRPRASYEEFAREVNSFDAMVGVHGAGLTNCVYLPTGAVLVQVVPYGRLEEIARADFGDPARDMGLRCVEYAVAADESSPMDVFGKDHPIVRDPVAVHTRGWGNVAEWYLGKQDVRINVERFRSVLKQAMEHLQ